MKTKRLVVAFLLVTLCYVCFSGYKKLAVNKVATAALRDSHQLQTTPHSNSTPFVLNGSPLFNDRDVTGKIPNKLQPNPWEGNKERETTPILTFNAFILNERQEKQIDLPQRSVQISGTSKADNRASQSTPPQQAGTNTTLNRQAELPPLSPTLIKGIKNFVLFVGYPRSGHSIVGTLMDAHPHVVISHEFNVFTRFADLNKVPAGRWRENLYNLLYRKSAYDVQHIRGDSRKGYSLAVQNLWQGKFERYIEVIGDKSGGITTRSYAKNKREFIKNYQMLQKRVRVPVRIIHVLRNPFDIISTGLVITNEGVKTFRELKLGSTNSTVPPVEKFNNSKLVDKRTELMFKRIDAVLELVEEVFGMGNVLHMHNCDLVSDPRGTVSRIFEFLGVEVSTHYLDVCAEKVYKSVSRSRNTVVWTPEQKEMVERRMKSYELLSRYNFTSN